MEEKQDKCSCHSTSSYTWARLSYICDLTAEWAQLLLLTLRSALLSSLIELVALRYKLTWMEEIRKSSLLGKRSHD